MFLDPGALSCVHLMRLGTTWERHHGKTTNRAVLAGGDGAAIFNLYPVTRSWLGSLLIAKQRGIQYRNISRLSSSMWAWTTTKVHSSTMQRADNTIPNSYHGWMNALLWATEMIHLIKIHRNVSNERKPRSNQLSNDHSDTGYVVVVVMSLIIPLIGDGMVRSTLNMHRYVVGFPHWCILWLLQFYGEIMLILGK